MRLDSDLTINQRIAVFRKLCGFSQAKMAEFMEMNTSTYSQMERRGKISSDMIIKLSEVLGVEPVELILGTEHKKQESAIADSRGDKTERKTDNPPKLPQPPEGLYRLTNREQNIIKIFRASSKQKQDDICDFILKTAGLGKWKKTK